MYIPYGFFGDKDVTQCVTASQEGTETGLFQSGSDVIKYHIWSGSGDYEFEITGSSTGSRIVLIGGGGHGGRTVQCNRDPGGFNAVRAAGGGGAGGVFDAPYTLVTSKFNIHVGSGSQHTASNGEDTWIAPIWNPNHPYPYQVYSSPEGANQNKAGEGGGFGGGLAWDWGYFGPNKPATQDAGGGGAGGGGAAGLMNESPALPGTVEWYAATEGGGRSGQGFDGGSAAGNACQSTSETTAAGGGGAGEQGEDTDCVFASGYLTPAGDGIELNLDGTPKYFAAGGGGVRSGVWENATYGLGSPGSGGSGSTDYFGGGAGNFDDPGFLDGFNLKHGRDGLAAVLIPLCQEQLNDCVQYELEGGASGGNFTFIACQSGSLTTYSLQPNESTTVCGFSGDVNNFPSASGTVTFNKTTSSCEVYIEPCPPVTESCTACTTIDNFITYDIQISGSKSFAPTLAPAVEITYTDCDEQVESFILNSGSIDMFDNIREWNICAHGMYGVSASIIDGDATASVNFISTSFECGEYCDIPSFQESTPLVATGGTTTGTFKSGSYIYKYHIFESSGSTNEATQRSFQQLDVTSGFADNVNMLVIGPGGPGANAEGTVFGQEFFWGAGGGAGQVQITNVVGGLCPQYTLNIAPGFAQPVRQPATVEDWQDVFGRTIVSASDGTFHVTAGVGGRGSYPGEYTSQDDWPLEYRSGSGGGGAGVIGTDINRNLGASSSLQYNGGNGWSGSILSPTGSAGGGGGSDEHGQPGTEGSTARGGQGGDGLYLNYTGDFQYYAGGGSGYGPGGGIAGGLGGGGTSGVGILGTGSFYGAGGGAALLSSSYTTPWGDTYSLTGKGADGAVIINYRWKLNYLPDDFIATRGLAQYYDIYDLNSYDGTGSLVYNLWKNDTTASLGNEQGWEYNTRVLDGSGSLEVISSSLHPFISTESESGSNFTLLTTWFSNNVLYDQSSSKYPLLTDEQFGTSSFGLYAGDLETYGEAIVIQVGDTEVTTISGSAGDFVPRTGFHISQFSYNQSTNELLWYVDGFSGSATVNEDVDIRDVNLSFNSSSLIYYPDANPTYGAALTASVYEIERTGSPGTTEINYVLPQTGELVNLETPTGVGKILVVASTQVPQVVQGTVTISSGSEAYYYPSASLYPGRTSNYQYQVPADGGADIDVYESFYNVSTCQWDIQERSLGSSPSTKSRNAGENSHIIFEDYTLNTTQSFVEFNDCITRPDVGLGNDSTFNNIAIYTSSLSWEEMRHNDDFLFPRY